MLEESNVLYYAKYFAAVVAGVITSFLGGWDTALKVLLLFVILDYATGVVAAWYEKRLDSDVGFKGICKKILLFVPIGIGYYMDQLLGQGHMLRSIAIWFYLVNEGLSVLENLGRLEVPVPQALLEALNQLRKRSETSNDGKDG